MNNKLLLDHLRCVPDWPKKGVNFRDVTTLFKNPECLKEITEEMYDLYKDKSITKIVGIESRGFVMSSALALKLNAGIILCRKPGKLPCETVQESYAMKAAYDLVKKFHPKKVYANFIIELVNEGMNGREAFDNELEISSLIKI